MVDEDPARADMANESDWVRIPDDDELWAAPNELPKPLVYPAPALLNTHEMEWGSFERLVLAMAKTVDGAYGALRYGRQGQAQHGLDIVGFFTERAPSVYQAKRRKKFGAADLEDCVELYIGGRRPFNADRIVVAVASEVCDAKTLEKLAELTATHDDVRIELWDQQEISDQLRSQSELVTRFFGRATAAAFCTNARPTVTPQESTSIAADAILRGPVTHLNLAPDLRRAEEMAEAQPEEAAHLFASVADRLEASGFVPHAAHVRGLQANALRAGGRRAEEAWVRLDLGWRQLEAGDLFSAGREVRQIAEWVDAPDDVVRCTNALSAAAGLRHNYSVTLDDLAEALDQLTNDDPHRVDAALVLAEEAVASRRLEFVAARADLLNYLAAALPLDDSGQLVAARLRMAVADSVGEWESLASTARDTYPPAVAALVLARSARHLALVPDPLGSVARWRDAIERACMVGHNADAADWLYSLRAVRVQNELIGDDINDLHFHAQALSAAGSGTLLPEPYRARERGLACLRAGKWPDALEVLRRYLWRSTIRADWAGEIEAHGLLADLFTQTNRVPDAIQHYVIAGERQKLEALAGTLPDAPTRVPVDLITPRAWERAAAYSFVAACADLIVDEDAREWCALAFGEIVAEPQHKRIFGPDPWLAAFKAFGQLALISTEEQARQFLEIGWKLLPRQPNTYRFTDDDHAQALLGIARAHPKLRAEAVDQLLQAVLLDQRMADLILRYGDELLRDDPVRTVAAVREAAAEGNQHAALALVITGDDTLQAVPVARQRLEAAIAPRVHEPGVLTLGAGLTETAMLVTVLPEEDRVRFGRGMVEAANDVQEGVHNRYQALIALRGVARDLPGDVRDELFDQLRSFVEGEYKMGEGDRVLAGSDDPLQRFRFSFGDVSLPSAALRGAAALAQSPAQYATVQSVAMSQLRDATDQAANEIASALASLPADQVTLPVDLLATHPNSSIRALAAVIWAQRPDQPEEIGVRLAKDRSQYVRRSLARSLERADRHTKVRCILVEDPRRSLRWLVDEHGHPDETTPV